jgi:hypothetical protein
MQNSSSQQFHPIHVACRSGHSYADRPTSFACNDERYEVTVIEQEWLEPGEKHFIVQSTRAETPHDEKRFEICYHTQEDVWQLNETQ